jgi:hypothetical protein
MMLRKPSILTTALTVDQTNQDPRKPRLPAQRKEKEKRREEERERDKRKTQNIGFSLIAHDGEEQKDEPVVMTAFASAAVVLSPAAPDPAVAARHARAGCGPGHNLGSRWSRSWSCG